MTSNCIEFVIAVKENLTIQIDKELAAKIGALAEQEGTSIHELVNEALRDFIRKKSQNVPRQHVMEALNSSVAKHNSLYKRLSQT